MGSRRCRSWNHATEPALHPDSLQHMVDLDSWIGGYTPEPGLTLDRRCRGRGGHEPSLRDPGGAGLRRGPRQRAARPLAGPLGPTRPPRPKRGQDAEELPPLASKTVLIVNQLLHT